MYRKCIKYLIVPFFLLIVCGESGTAESHKVKTLDSFSKISLLEAQHYSYINGSDKGAKYGRETSLQIKKHGKARAIDHISYLKFELPKAASEQIVLPMIKSGGEEATPGTSSTSTDWDENTPDWLNAPKVLNSITKGAFRIDDTVYVGVTDYIKSEIDDEVSEVSFAVNTSIGNPLTAYSRETEDSVKRPTLLFDEEQKFDTVEDIELSSYISSNMIIQRSHSFPFRGKGPVGETIKLDFERDGTHYTHSTTVNASGNFLIELEPLQATTTACTATLQIKGQRDTKISLDNILIGDVWFAGGQSNMEKKVDYMLGANYVMADADHYKNIRGFRASYNDQAKPLDYIRPDNDSWFILDSDEVDRASAVAYIFAKEVYKSNTDIPIGLMQAYVGGTEIETWISEDKIESDPNLQLVENCLSQLDPKDQKAYQRYPSVNYNGMINPLANYPIKGFLFYQGESNVKKATEYDNVFKSLIEDWRSKWGLGDLPFYYVQLPNIGIAADRNYENESLQSDTWQMLREQQLRVLKNKSIKNLGMAVTIETNKEHLNPDILTRIHPKNKKPGGKRLAKIALKEQYGQSLIAYSPFPADYYVSGNKLYITFKNVGNGLKIREGKSKLKGFAIAGTDDVYHKATATIVGSNEVSLFSPSVSNPVSAAYGWSRDPICTLDNSADLPASPFRTDDQELFK